MTKYVVVSNNKFVWKRNPDILNDTFYKRFHYPHLEVDAPKGAKRIWGLTDKEKWAHQYFSKEEAERVAVKVDGKVHVAS